jgi:DNA polymerase-1
VLDLFGVEPSQLGDLLALTGDRGEAPGVPGIGPKTAAEILRAHGSLEQALDRWSLVQGRASNLLREHAEAARLSQRLVSLRRDLDLPVALDDMRPWNPSRACLDAFFGRFGFDRFESAVDGRAR